MTDEYKGNDVTPGEEGTTQPPIAEATADTSAPEPITKQEFAQFQTELKEELKRIIQSQTGKAESRIKKEVDSKLSQVEANFKSLREAGYPVTDEDLKEARTQAIRGMMSTLADNESAAQQTPTASNPQEQAVVKQANEALKELQNRYGYVLGKNDPEFWAISNKFYDFQAEAWIGPPDEFIPTYEQKLREINTRLGRPVPQEINIQGSPSARIPSPVGSATGGSIEALNNELGMLQSKSGRTAADEKRRKEIEAELLKHVPRK